jgi:hypothetical protein
MRYLISLDAVFCAQCCLFNPPVSCEKAFSSSELTDWKNLISLVKRHENLSHHRGCVVMADNFIRAKQGKHESVASMISSSHKQIVAENRHALTRIIDVIILCGRQNIPIRGHVEERSNFLAILHEVAKGDQALSDWLALRSGTRSTYLSPDIHNELINICGQQILTEIVDDCRKSTYFAIIADECTDVATKEQLSVCVRFLHKTNENIEIRDELIGFRHAKSIRGERIADIIVQFLNEVHLDIRNVRAQCYDGAANMAGKYNGVQAKITELSPQASYIHCKAHQLNLALVHSSKELCVRNMMSTVQEIAFSFDYSAKRLTAFSAELADNQNVQEEMERRSKLRTLCETRWSSRADSLFTFRTAFSVIVSALETLKNDKDEKAGLYLTAILKFDFIVALVVAEHILSSTVALTNYLQKPEIDLVEAVTEAKIVVSRLSDERNDDQVWDALHSRACDIASEFDIEPCTPRVVGRQRNRANHPARNPKDYWCVSLYLVFLDHLVSEISNRVISNEERFLASYLSPVKHQSLTPDIVYRVFAAYATDLGRIDKIDRWKIRWQQNIDKPERLIAVLNATNVDLYPSIHRILTILLTMPVSSATSERSFSAMRRIKSYLRSTMGDERLSSLSLMHVLRQIPVEIDKVLSEFINRKNRRLDFS